MEASAFAALRRNPERPALVRDGLGNQAQHLCDRSIRFGTKEPDHLRRPADRGLRRPGRWNPASAALGDDGLEGDARPIRQENIRYVPELPRKRRRPSKAIRGDPIACCRRTTSGGLGIFGHRGKGVGLRYRDPPRRFASAVCACRPAFLVSLSGSSIRRRASRDSRSRDTTGKRPRASTQRLRT